ncbi:glycosyltransferase family 4 protein [Klebsiella pneumoniae]|uniref:glycosyltransferase family 4 protein n=1 Tax=Klebsiella pneumoniae TaxID=573 RepID=UPI00098346CB|nr:glycosyltransferase family 4 protein [Klebsiella pneumoniae]HCM6844985.1 glycosyltransferase family 4 protein [Klebsiella quasipneumoniae]MCL7658736.1 glycosyltransferase family 4 protein [Klebsiella pneumoniae]MCQ0636500.1 glycosyltransferase family 4 protein [Klebsiella pneumoniae]PLD45178.1 hypothetical protein B6I55_19085 [Klebsiella pneumoniae]SSK05634.1 glycosyltransferase [Klebsiella pneumoniae]
MSKIKLLYILPDMSNAGPVNMCLNLIQGLNIKDYEIKIIALGGGEMIEQFKYYADVKILSRKNIFAFRNYVRQYNFDIIHSHTIIADLFSNLSRCKSLRLTTIHNYPDIDSIYRRGKLVGGILFQLQKHVIKNILKVACSHAVKEYCATTLHLNNIVSIPNGVCAKEIPERVISDETVRFYYLGSITRRKNVDELLDAFISWCDDKNTHLSIIGDGDLLDVFSKKYQNEKITFHGKVKSPSVVINKLDCFVSSSKAEGMPLALLESLSLGKAYICSNIAPHKEVFNNDRGLSGQVYELGNDKLLIKALDDYYNSGDKKLLSYNARKCFEKYYDVKLMSSEYDKLYKSIVRNSN